MVNYSCDAPRLDLIFASLSDPIRRDILERVHDTELTVSEIALPYHISLAAISKHLNVLESASLIHRRADGRKRFISRNQAGFRDAYRCLKRYGSG